MKAAAHIVWILLAAAVLAFGLLMLALAGFEEGAPWSGPGALVAVAIMAVAFRLIWMELEAWR